jgi:gas vesicle protein GvpL/GvpF
VTPEMDGKRAIYLFCLAGSDSLGDLRGSGLDDTHPLFALRCGGITAISSAVPVDDFCGPEAERKLRDPEWVGERAMRHGRAVETAFRYGPVLPARFGTLFSSPEALGRFVETNRQTIAGFLDAVCGHEEWGIKALLERSTAKKWLGTRMATAAADGGPAISPGLRYLRERRAQAAAEKDLNRWLAASCDSVARDLRQPVSDWRQRKILDVRVPGDPRATVLNFAVLIRRDRVEDLLLRAAALNAERAAQGLSFTLTGPWPPYSFCPSLEMPP